MNRKYYLSLIIAGIFSPLLFAQINDIGTFMSGGVADGQKCITEYIRPYANAFGTNLSGGWYNTAKPHKLGGFDLSLSTSISFVPSADQQFDLDKLGLTGSYSNSLAPTAAGKAKTGPEIAYQTTNPALLSDTITLAKYNLPQGSGLPFLPLPMIKLGIGFIKGTEFMGRYMPTLTIGQFGSMGLWGVGVKHSISQYMGLVDRLPALNISIMGGYTRFNSGFNLNVTPDDFSAADSTVSVSFNGQKLQMAVTNLTTNLLISVDLPILCIYGGAGFTKSTTNLALKGYYPVPDMQKYMIDDAGNVHGVVTDNSSLLDPLNIKIKSKDGSALKPRFNVGMRLKFGLFTLYGDYTYANYSMATVGMGISFR